LGSARQQAQSGAGFEGRGFYGIACGNRFWPIDGFFRPLLAPGGSLVGYAGLFADVQASCIESAFYILQIGCSGMFF